MPQSANHLPRLTSIILDGHVGLPMAPNAVANPLWQVAYRQYNCADEQQQLVRAPDATAARLALEANLSEVGCQILRVTPFAAPRAVGAGPQPRVRGRARYLATQFNYLGDHPAVRLAVTPRSAAVGYAACSSTAAAGTDRSFALKPGWWLLEKDGQVMAAIPPAQFAAGFEPAETQADAGVRNAVEALCREIENEPFALREPASSEKRGRLHVLAKLKAILAAN